MGKLFGTDGVRGLANEGNMTPEVALRIGRAVGALCLEEVPGKPLVVLGKDTRISGDMLEAALVAGLTSVGVDVALLDVLPTPAISFLAKEIDAAAGIVISASHNPFFDNGIKIFGAGGCKLSDEAEAKVESWVLGDELDTLRPQGDQVGAISYVEDAEECYIDFCCKSVGDTRLEGMKVVLDCANGATSPIAAEIFANLGADVVVIHNSPDGININENCGSQHTNDLKNAVIESGAHCGLAFDGDGDRLIAVDVSGNELSGDQIIAILAKAYKERGELAANKVVGTVMSNVGFHAAMRDLGIETGTASVGDRHVLEMMRRDGAVVGGESSGHIILLDQHTTGDGIIAGLQLLRVAVESRQSLAELATVMRVFPQCLINVDVASKPEISEVQPIVDAIAKAEETLGEDGRVLIRYSGTQPMCRVMVEGPSEELTQQLTNELAAVVKENLG